MGALLRVGIPLGSTSWLEVRGRRSGELRGVPVNVCTHDGADHLVSPRGTTQWVRNIRVAGECGVDGRTRPATEVVDAAIKEAVLATYLSRWSWQVKSIMDVESPDPAAHPVFRPG